MADMFEPKILAFLCKWCSYAAADLAGVSRCQYPPNVRTILTMCSGRVDPVYVMEGLRRGFDGVFVFGWHFGDCHYLDGNVHTAKRMEILGRMLDTAGIGKDRLQLRWVSSAEGKIFAEYITELTGVISTLGPLDREKLKLPLAAVERALESVPLRWLMGMERQLTERENVFHEKLAPERYQEVLRRIATDEYQKALLFEALREGPKTVRQLADSTTLPVYTVSLRLNDLERAGLADIHGHEGINPTFKVMTA